MKLTSSLIVFTICFIVLISFFPSIARSETNSQSNSETKDEVYIPKNLEEAFVELKKSLPANELKEFKETPEDEIIKYHFSLGMGLRNRWGLWGGSRLAKYFNGIGIFHPDDMSGIIIESFWRNLNKRLIQLEKQVEYYQEYWKYNMPAENAVSPIDGSAIDFISSHPCEDTTISEHCMVHFGVSKSDGTPWAYQYGKGVFEPSETEKKSILKHANQLDLIKNNCTTYRYL